MKRGCAVQDVEVNKNAMEKWVCDVCVFVELVPCHKSDRWLLDGCVWFEHQITCAVCMCVCVCKCDSLTLTLALSVCLL